MLLIVPTSEKCHKIETHHFQSPTTFLTDYCFPKLYKERKKKRIQRKKEKENGANQEDGIYVTFLEYVNDNKLFNL